MGVSTEIKERLATAKPLPAHHEAYIRHVGFVTGSTAFGVGAADTDVDICILAKSFKNMRLEMDILCYGSDELYEFGGYRSFYVKCADGAVINLLVMDDEKIMAQFRYATDCIVGFMKRSEDYAERIENKDFRCGAFQSLRFIGAWLNEKGE